MKGIILIIILITSLFASIEKDVLFNNEYNKISYGNSNSSYECTHSNGNELILTQCKTDKGPVATIKLKNINIENPIIVEREVYIHPDNEYFVGQLNLSQGKDKLFTIAYDNYEYQCYCHFFWVNDKSNKINPIWNKWFSEKIIYYPKNGKLQYFINKKLKLSLNSKPVVTNKNLKLNMSTYGWWTGHYTKMKNLKIYQLNLNKYYQDINKKHKLKLFQNFIKTYPNASQVKDAIRDIHKLAFDEAKSIGTISAYNTFIKTYPNAPQDKDALQKSYNLINEENNIVGYEWFAKTYPNAPQVKDAINNIHKLAFDEAKSIGTISAYNTFIIAYPYAKQVEDANQKAYKLEEKKYTDLGMLGFFNKDGKMEKKARKLLIKAKQMERYPIDNGIKDRKAGYAIVANRMYKLLQNKFDDTDATLRYLESQEFKGFVANFRSIMSDIKYTLRQIQNNTSSSSQYIKELVQISSKGFEDAKADRAMSEYYTKQHRQWQKYMHFRDNGYN